MIKRVKAVFLMALLVVCVYFFGKEYRSDERSDPQVQNGPMAQQHAEDTGEMQNAAEDAGEMQSAAEDPDPDKKASGKDPIPEYRAPQTPEAFRVIGIRLFGGKIMEVERGEVWRDPGAAPYDECARYGYGEVAVTGQPDMNTCGRYELHYSLTDEQGNEHEAVRIVYVRPNEQDIREAEEKGKLIYLTFDDGTSAYTARLLDILKKYGVKATFFVCNMGRNHLFSRELEEGHTLAIHSYSHEFSEIYVSEEAFFEDLSKMRRVIYRETGYLPTLLRFPGGSSNAASKAYGEGIMTRLAQAVGERGYVYFDWNVSCGDGNRDIDTERIIENVKNGVSRHRVSVVLMHESHGYTVDAVEEIIIWALENGYTFMPLSKYSYPAHHAIKN